MTYHGRKVFDEETVEQKTRKYTRPHPVVTSHLRNLQNSLFTAPPTWQNAIIIGLPQQQPLPLMQLPSQSLVEDMSRKRRYNISNAHSSGDKYIDHKKRRHSIPTFSFGKNENYLQLSNEIKTYSNIHQQSIDLLQKKLRLRSALLTVFRKQFPAASLHLVGSSCNGFATETSDADFCVMLTQQRKVDQRYEACFYLKAFQKLLRSMASIKQVQFIRAKVPILKFRDNISGCECDVNVNNAIGIRNTHLLRTYSKLDSRVRPLVISVKWWAKSHRINDASQGTLSSYSLVLMVIHYLQSGCKPPILVSLQQEYPEFFNPNTSVDNLPMFEPADLMPCNRSENRESLGELLYGFFEYYAKDFKWDFKAISVRLGYATPKELQPDGSDKFICIEEPFERTNTARAVYADINFKMIKQTFLTTHNRLKQNLCLEAIMQ